jgi:threonine dehydratase
MKNRRNCRATRSKPASWLMLLWRAVLSAVAHTLPEAADAASLAAAYNLRAELAGSKIGVVCSGGNTSIEHLRQALERQETAQRKQDEGN